MPMNPEPVVVAARKAKAFRIPGGASVRIVNPHGTQVLDTWAFASGDPAEFMSMEHSRLHMGRLSPIVEDRFVTSRRRPILMLTEDTSGGVHDTLLAACDEHRYALLGYVGRHDNCTDNLHAALREMDIRISHTPAPLNLFENAWPDRQGVIAIQPPVCGPGG